MNLGYFHELARFAEGTIGRLWFGGWIDEGSAFEELSAATFYTNVTAGFVLESPIGPVFAGTSVGLDGRVPRLLQRGARLQIAAARRLPRVRRHFPFSRAARIARNSVPGFHSGQTLPCATARPTPNSSCASSTAPLRSQSAFTSSLTLW